MRTNVDATKRLLELAAAAAGVKRFVHVSTEAVLIGGKTMVNAGESWPRPKKPIGIYSRTKALAEMAVLDANREGFATIAVRPRFVWGEGDTSLLPKIVEEVRTGKFAWISGSRNLTSSCHVRPPLPHGSFHLFADEVTVDDSRARRELGYAGEMSREDGLREMRNGLASLRGRVASSIEPGRN